MSEQSAFDVNVVGHRFDGTSPDLVRSPSNVAPIGQISHAPGAAWLPLAAINPLFIAEWHDLAGDAAEPNAFAEAWFALSGMRHCDRARQVRLAVVRDERGALIGTMPLAVSARLGRLPLRTLGDWRHANCFLGAACVRADNVDAFWTILLQGLSRFDQRARAACFGDIAEGGVLHAGLLRACRSLRLPIVTETRSQRAMLATDLDAEAYWEASVRPKKRKELRRQWARLAEQGELSAARLAADADPEPWIEEFLALEASGWKGAEGSALVSRSDTAAMVRDALSGAYARGQLDISALRIDGRAIAMLVQLIGIGAGGQRAGFSFKTAFDEAYARFSPGVLLQRESLSLLGERNLAWFDSCAAQDHPMIDSLWRERRTIVSLSMPLPGATNRMLFSAAQRAKSLWHSVKHLLPAKPRP